MSKQQNELSFWVNVRDTVDKDSYSNPFIEFCRNKFDFKQGKVRLEVGCGPHNSFHIRDDTLIGTDPLLEEYYKAGYSKWFTPVLSTEHRLPFPDNVWEDVYFLNVLDHCQYKEVIINEICRIMKKGGKLYFFVDLGAEDGCHYHLTRENVMTMLNNKFDVSGLNEIISPHRGGLCNALYGVLIKL